MSILRGVWEKIKDATKVLLGGAAAVGISDIIKDTIKDHGVKVATDLFGSFASGKGLINEHFYGIILDACDLTTEQRNLHLIALEEMRDSENKKEVEAANNFIIVVAIGSDGKGMVPGKKIIDGYIHRLDEFATKKEKMDWIKLNIKNIGTDAEIKGKVAKLRDAVASVWKEIKAPLDFLNEFSSELLEEAKEESAKYDKRGFISKIFFN